MATEATAETAKVEAGGRRELGRRSRDRLAGWTLSLPVVVLLLVFFLLPIYFIVRYSLGLERFARTEAAAELTGELGAFSTSSGETSSASDAALEILGYVDGLVPDLGARGRVRPARPRRRVRRAGSRRWGAWIAAGSFVLLLAPFMTIPWGNNLLRIARDLVGGRLPAALLQVRDDGDDVVGASRS